MRTSLKHIGLFLITFLISAGSYAQWDTTWIKTYGGNRDDKAFDIVQSNDNGFLIIGSTSSFGFDNSQMYFLKLDSTGAIMWSKSHGGTGQESGQSVIQTSDGGYFGVGYTNSWGAGGFDFFMVKLDSNGNMEYEDYYGGSDWDFAWDVVEVSPNQYVIAGETQSYGAGGKDGWIIKYNGLTQTVEWDKTVGTSSVEYFKAITLGENNNLIAVGGGVKSGRTDEDVMVTKFNSLGDTLWNKYYGDTLQDYANDVIWMSNGNYALTGAKTPANDTTVVNLMTLDTLGIMLQQDQWGVGPFLSAEGMKILEMDSNRISVSGTYQISKYDFNMFIGYSYPFGLFFEEGSTIGGGKSEYGMSHVYAGHNQFFTVGITNGFNSSFIDIITYRNARFGVIVDPNIFTFNEDVSNITGINNKEPLQQILKFNSFTQEIQNTTNSPLDLKLYNSIGQIIRQIRLNPNANHSLRNMNLPSGLYFTHPIINSKTAGETLQIYFTQ